MGRFFQFMTKRKERRAQANDRSRLPYAWNKDRADTSSLSLDDATDYEEAPWRAAAVLASHPIEEKDWWVGKEEGDAASSPPPLYHTRTETAGDPGTTEETHFHNRGYEVWERCRQAWRHTAASSDRITTSSSGRSPLRSPLRRRMMSSLVQKKQYALPRNLGLGEMVEVYQEIWHGDSSE